MSTSYVVPAARAHAAPLHAALAGAKAAYLNQPIEHAASRLQLLSAGR